MQGSVKKNILDLNFQKQLVIASTAVIVAFTYLIGVVIAIFARQITVAGKSLGILSAFSVIVLGLCGNILYKATMRMREVLEEIQNMV